MGSKQDIISVLMQLTTSKHKEINLFNQYKKELRLVSAPAAEIHLCDDTFKQISSICNFEIAINDFYIGDTVSPDFPFEYSFLFNGIKFFCLTKSEVRNEAV